jgi:hypothetical protein
MDDGLCPRFQMNDVELLRQEAAFLGELPVKSMELYT